MWTTVSTILISTYVYLLFQAKFTNFYATVPNVPTPVPSTSTTTREDNKGQHRRETERKARNKMQKAMDDVHVLLAEHNVDRKGKADAIISLVLLCRWVTRIASGFWKVPTSIMAELSSLQRNNRITLREILWRISLSWHYAFFIAFSLFLSATLLSAIAFLLRTLQWHLVSW